MIVNPLDVWLSLTKEEPLEASLPICDPHHHLLDYPDSYPDSSVPKWARPIRHYLLEQFLKDTANGHNIVATVFVQCDSMYKKDGPQELRPVGETEFVQGIAAQSASGQYGNTVVAAGIVGFANLMLGSAVACVLETHISTSKDRFRGIRFLNNWDASKGITPPPSLLSDTKLREGFAQLRKYNLSFDAGPFFPHLPDLADLARVFPDTTIVLDHTGGPIGVGQYAGKHNEVFQQWKNGINELSTCTNVVVKLGGLGMPIFGFGWSDRTTPVTSAELAYTMAPYYLWCIEKFGVNRCMFESNFPADKISYSYNTIWNAFKRIVEDFSPQDKSALFHDTAMRVYRLSNKQ
jgi:predicted TIM-barrel fold metal-dependent hydrolase